MAIVEKLPSGSFRAKVYCGKDENGKQIRKSFTASTRWQAEKMADEYVKNGMKEDDKLTIAEAIDGYIFLKENILSPSTIRGYKIIRNTRLQGLMNLDVSELNSLKMQKAINIDAARLTRKSISEAKNLVLTALKMYGIKPDIEVTLPPKKPKIKELPTVQQVVNIGRGNGNRIALLTCNVVITQNERGKRITIWRYKK